MWNPEKLILKKFMSHLHSEFVFAQDKLTLIFGKNEDDKDSGANSNGSGKSVPIEGITVALTGETYRDVPKDVMIMDDEDEAEIDFVLNNPALNQRLRIHWIITRGKAAKVYIYENDSKEYNKQITTVNEAKKYILEKIGISREDLLNFFIINQGNNNSFFTAGDAKQKEIISRFANYDIVNIAIKKIEQEKEELVSDLDTIFVDKSNQIGIKESFESLIEEEKNNVKSNKDDELKVIADKRLNKEEQIKDLLLKVGEKESELSTIEKVIKEKEKEKKENDELIESSKETYSEKNKIEDKIESDKRLIKKYQSSMEHKISCPSCSHEFILNSELTLEEIKEKIEEIDSLIEARKAKLEELSEMIIILDQVKESNESLSAEIRTSKRKLSTLKDDIEDLNSQVERGERFLTNLDKEKEELLNQEEEKTNIPLYQSKIKEAEERMIELDELHKEISLQVDEKNFWLIHLGKKGFTTFLANKCISVVEKICNTYLEDMKVNLRVKINGYKQLASGELREKIEVLITKDGDNSGPFYKFSGGQRERVVLAGILTFQSLINNSLNGKGLNLLCLDESIDFLDEKGQKTALAILQNVGLTTLVISHSNVENILEEYNKILVTFSKGISKIQ